AESRLRATGVRVEMSPASARERAEAGHRARRTVRAGPPAGIGMSCRCQRGRARSESAPRFDSADRATPPEHMLALQPVRRQNWAMKITVRGRIRHFRTVAFDSRRNAVLLIEQRLLPHDFQVVATRN